ncbi:MAG: hypothetical protein U0636_02490 [Phycisphaerales bacterium]
MSDAPAVATHAKNAARCDGDWAAKLFATMLTALLPDASPALTDAALTRSL